MTTWITKKNNRIDRIRQTKDDTSPGPEWFKVLGTWNGNPEDKLEWFDADMRRIPDTQLVASGIRKDNRGTWINKDSRETKTITGLDMEPGEGWTRKPLIENEPYQKWNEPTESWIIDTEAKEKAEKDRLVSEKKAAIEDAERRIQRSARAKLAGTATTEDEEYFQQINDEIETLREDVRQLMAV